MDLKGITRTTAIAIIIVILIVSAVAVYYVTLPPPKVPLATITGKVTDAKTGLPVAGAIVTLDGLKYITGPDGTYSFSVKVGKYTVTVSMMGYEPKTASVDAPEEKTYTVNVSIPPTLPREQVIKNIMEFEKGFRELTKIIASFEVFDELRYAKEIVNVTDFLIEKVTLIYPPGPDLYYSLPELKELLISKGIDVKGLEEFKEYLRNFLNREIGEKDILARTMTKVEYPFKIFENPFIINGTTLKPKFDTFGFFVPVQFKAFTISESLSQKVFYKDIILNGTNIYGKPIVTAHLKVDGTLFASSGGTIDYKLVLNFNSWRDPLLLGWLYDIFSSTVIAMGVPKMPTKEGDNILERSPLEIRLFIEGCGKFTKNYDMEVTDNLNPDPNVAKRFFDPFIGDKLITIKVNLVRNGGYFARRGAKFIFNGTIIGDTKGEGHIYFESQFFLTNNLDHTILRVEEKVRVFYSYTCL